MAIFNSYVKLPEGKTHENTMLKPCQNWTFKSPLDWQIFERFRPWDPERTATSHRFFLSFTLWIFNIAMENGPFINKYNIYIYIFCIYLFNYDIYIYIYIRIYDYNIYIYTYIYIYIYIHIHNFITPTWVSSHVCWGSARLRTASDRGTMSWRLGRLSDAGDSLTGDVDLGRLGKLI